jgi:hypothetical protein
MKMIIGIQGSKAFSNYRVFLRAMQVALSGLKENDNSVVILSAGPSSVNAMSLEFSNITERSFKARGIKIQVKKVSPQWVENNIHSIDYMAYFSLPKEPTSSLFKLAEAKGVEAYTYSFD